MLSPSLTARFADHAAVSRFVALVAPDGRYDGTQVARVMGEALRLSYGLPVRADEVERAFAATIRPRQVARGLCG